MLASRWPQIHNSCAFSAKLVAPTLPGSSWGGDCRECVPPALFFVLLFGSAVTDRMYANASTQRTIANTVRHAKDRAHAMSIRYRSARGAHDPAACAWVLVTRCTNVVSKALRISGSSAPDRLRRWANPEPCAPISEDSEQSTAATSYNRPPHPERTRERFPKRTRATSPTSQGYRRTTRANNWTVATNTEPQHADKKANCALEADFAMPLLGHRVKVRCPSDLCELVSGVRPNCEDDVFDDSLLDRFVDRAERQGR